MLTVLSSTLNRGRSRGRRIVGGADRDNARDVRRAGCMRPLLCDRDGEIVPARHARNPSSGTRRSRSGLATMAQSASAIERSGRRRPDLVGHDAHRAALAHEPQHGAHEIPARWHRRPMRCAGSRTRPAAARAPRVRPRVWRCRRHSADWRDHRVDKASSSARRTRNPSRGATSRAPVARRGAREVARRPAHSHACAASGSLSARSTAVYAAALTMTSGRERRDQGIHSLGIADVEFGDAPPPAPARQPARAAITARPTWPRAPVTRTFMERFPRRAATCPARILGRKLRRRRPAAAATQCRVPDRSSHVRSCSGA